jgi:ankyrin repeat protein
MRAADNADAALIALLLEHGANKQAKDRNGRTPQMWAAQRQDDSGLAAAKLLE